MYFFQVWSGCFLIFLKLKENLLFDPKQNCFLWPANWKISSGLFPIVHPQQSCSMQLYQSWIRALLLKNLQEQDSSATCSKFSPAILVKFVNICSYSTSVLMDVCPHSVFFSCLIIYFVRFCKTIYIYLLVCLVKLRFWCNCRVSISGGIRSP